MKITKKRGVKALALLMAATLSIGALAGCETKDNKKDGKISITIANWPAVEGDELEMYEERKATFEKEHPNVEIIPSEWKFDIKSFYAKAEGGELPTLYTSHFTEIDSIIGGGYAADISDALEARGYNDKINDLVFEQVKNEEGKVSAFPYNPYTLGLAYNAEMFRQAGLMNEDGTPMEPKTWEELAEFAVKIKEKTGKAGFLIPSSGNGGGWMFSSIAWSYGTKFMKQDENGKWIATFDSPEATAALQFVKDLKWKYKVTPANTLIDNTEAYKQYGTENVGMIIAPGTVSWEASTYEMPVDNFGLMPLPAGPERRVTLLGGTAYFMAPDATPEQIEACLDWLEMTVNYKATDEYKKNTEKKYMNDQKINRYIGGRALSIWNQDTDVYQFETEMIEKYKNSNLNQVKLYNDSLISDVIEIQPEEPMCCQALYGILDNCIQKVWTDENADCAAILKEQNKNFQRDYLDSL